MYPLRLNRFWQHIVLLLFNCILISSLTYGLEFYLTVTDPAQELPPKPEERENQYGFREREFKVPKPPGICRIIALGDSFTWGKGVWVEERYTTLLEFYLNQSYPLKKFEVLSFGAPGGPTTRARDILFNYKDEAQPDLIIVGFVLNDPQPRQQDYSVEKERFESQYGDEVEETLDSMSALRLEHVADLMEKSLNGLLTQVGIIPTWQAALQRTYEQDSAEWQAFEDALRDIKTVSDDLNLPQPIFAVLNQGVYTDQPTDYAHPDANLQLFLEWYHQAEAMAAALGFNPINFEAEFRAEMSDEIMAVTPLDLHPSPRMHRIYAQKLLVEVKKYVDTSQMCDQDFVPYDP